MTLKTLKDIKSRFKVTAKVAEGFPDCDTDIESKIKFVQNFFDAQWIEKRDLKEEAIKWIEMLNKRKQFYIRFNDEVKMNIIKEHINDWMNFFNITDDELK